MCERIGKTFNNFVLEALPTEPIDQVDSENEQEQHIATLGCSEQFNIGCEYSLQILKHSYGIPATA